MRAFLFRMRFNNFCSRDRQARSLCFKQSYILCPSLSLLAKYWNQNATSQISLSSSYVGCECVCVLCNSCSAAGPIYNACADFTFTGVHPRVTYWNLCDGATEWESLTKYKDATCHPSDPFSVSEEALINCPSNPQIL